MLGVREVDEQPRRRRWASSRCQPGLCARSSHGNHPLAPPKRLGEPRRWAPLGPSLEFVLAYIILGLIVVAIAYGVFASSRWTGE